MKVFVTKSEMQLAVLAYFGLPINAEVELEGEEPVVVAEEVVEAEVEEVSSIKPRKRRRRRKQNDTASSEPSEEVQEVSPQVSADELAEQVESEVEPVNDTALNEYPNVDGIEVQSESDSIEEDIVAPRNDIEIPEFVGGTSDDEAPFDVGTGATYVESFESLFENDEENEEESLTINTGGNDVKLFEEVIAETPEEDELPVNETPSLFL